MQILDVSKDPYGHRFYNKQKRKSFEQLKRTAVFKKWKQRQMRIQEDRCAYCRIPLTHRNIVTHVDHVDPLRFDGTNDFKNLVLCCRRCNNRKWIATNRVIPSWVKENKLKLEKRERLSYARKQQKQQMRELVQREIDEQIGYELNQMFRED